MRISDWSSDVCSSDLEVSGWQSRDEAGSTGPSGFDSDAILEAMYSQDPALTINPFVSDGSSPASREFLQSLLVSFDHQSRSSTNGLTGYMRGKLFTLPAGNVIGLVGAESQRSEEHTSELQSLMRISYAVFCLK